MKGNYVVSEGLKICFLTCISVRSVNVCAPLFIYC